jgi:hypothetical protein
MFNLYLLVKCERKCNRNFEPKLIAPPYRLAYLPQRGAPDVLLSSDPRLSPRAGCNGFKWSPEQKPAVQSEVIATLPKTAGQDPSSLRTKQHAAS